jgi:hypothetical protein
MRSWFNRILAAFGSPGTKKRPFRRKSETIFRRPESLERRELLSADPAPTPAAAMTPAPAPFYLPGQPGDGTNQTFVNNVYRELLGRNVDPTGAAYWMNFLAQNPASQQPLNNGGTAINNGLGASGFALGTTSLNGAQVEGPNGGYAITEFPQGFGNGAFPNGNPTSAISTLGPEGPNGGYAGSPMSNVGGTGVFTQGSGYSPGLSQNYATGSPVPAANYGTAPNYALSGNLPVDRVSTGATAAAAFRGAALASASPRAQMADAILSTPEYQHHIITAIYENFLHRAPAADALNYWSGQLAASGEQAVISRIAGSQEYYQDNGGTDASFVDALYRDLLGRTPSPQAQAYWISQIQSLSHPGGTGDISAARAQVVLDMLSTPEARGLLLNNPTGNALANVTGGGFEQLFYQDNLSPQAQQTFFADYATSPSYEAEINNLITQGAFYDRTLGIGPGPGNNPAAPLGFVV